jgi:hypothetical protein
MSPRIHTKGEAGWTGSHLSLRGYLVRALDKSIRDGNESMRRGLSL